jgi:hypothetical protein
LIFKHAISTVVMGRPLPHGAHVTHSDGKAAAGTVTASASAPTTASAASASGTEG